MQDLAFSLNATMPVFLLMLVGMVLRRFRVIDDAFAARLNSFVFHVALPVLLFGDMAAIDFAAGFDASFVAQCFALTLGCIAISVLLSAFLRRPSERGEFIQASYRSSAALLGVALLQNMYGSSQAAALMIVGAVPLYNVAAVIALAFAAPDTSKRPSTLRTRVKESRRGIVFNPIIIGIVAGFAYAALRLPMPEIAAALIESIGGLATPLGLMAMGAMFDIRRASGHLAPALGASAVKLVGLAAALLPVSVALGARGEELAAIAVMLASPTTVSCFVMARAMGHDGMLSSTVVMATTLGSAFTLTAWFFVLRSLGLL
ncbi:MAG: AEC family transporter [Slackia sp.]|nr:AEC family transporter [Slackia sp.]